MSEILQYSTLKGLAIEFEGEHSQKYSFVEVDRPDIVTISNIVTMIKQSQVSHFSINAFSHNSVVKNAWVYYAFMPNKCDMFKGCEFIEQGTYWDKKQRLLADLIEKFIVLLPVGSFVPEKILIQARGNRLFNVIPNKLTLMFRDTLNA